ncbi:hypothetical protein ELI44_36645, partial [Rhizobium ruizarguesonis]
LDPLQITLAHRNQSHPQSPTPSNKGSVTFQLCRNRTLQLCGYNILRRNQHYGTIRETWYTTGIATWRRRPCQRDRSRPN